MRTIGYGVISAYEREHGMYTFTTESGDMWIAERNELTRQAKTTWIVRRAFDPANRFYASSLKDAAAKIAALC